MSTNSKVVLIGLDGATLHVLLPLAKLGVIPTLARWMREGAYGHLLSTRPPVTCPAWPTMFTGVNPGKHGVFSFNYRDPQSGEVRTASSADVRAPRIWTLISEAGRRAGVFNVPITFPAERINGRMLTGFVSPDDSPRITWPESLREELRERFTDLALNWVVLGQRPRGARKREEHVRRINELLDLRAREFDHLVDHAELDFCFLVHEHTDRVHHLFYQALDPRYEAHHSPANQKVVELLHEGFRVLDASLARLADQFGPEANYMVVSDHGFDAVRQWVYVNNLLERHGLAVAHRFRTAAEVVTRKAHLPARIRRWVGVEPSEPWHRQDPFRGRLIDYGRTKAFAGPQLEHAVYVNLKGRCPEGIVEPGDYELVRQEVIDVLSGATDPHGGGKIFEGVWRREEIYSGEWVRHGPDVVYELAPGYMASNAVLPGWLLGGRYLRELRGGWSISGYHRPDGVLIGWGPAFRQADNLRASIADIAPTVLYLMDLSIPSYMDGRLIEQALRPECLRARPPKRHEAELSHQQSSETPYTAEQLREVTRRLEDLGYL